jgi:hypothetical protein
MEDKKGVVRVRLAERRPSSSFPRRSRFIVEPPPRSIQGRKKRLSRDVYEVRDFNIT